MKYHIKQMLVTVMVLLAEAAYAQASPVGLWRSIDENSGAVTGEIRISEKAGVLTGKIEKNLESNAKTNDTCSSCRDDRKDQAVIGLEIIRGARKTAGKDIWEGGTILDPNDGALYKLKLSPIEGGKKLQVRGFVGVPILGRTQTWLRVE